MKKYSIDKSQLLYGTKSKVYDEQYRKSYKDRPCAASRNGIDLCGDLSIGAHIRTGEVAGMGTKPSDDLTEGLCNVCHMDQEAQPGPEWWIENVYKPQRRRAYREWKEGKLK